MEYEIIATLGPASHSPAIWQAMIAAGATGFRLNTSHLTQVQLRSWLKEIADFRIATGIAIPLVLDLQGSKWRLGNFPAITVQAGQMVRLVYGQESQQAGVLPVAHLDFFQAAVISSPELVLNDAKVRLVVKEAADRNMLAQVVQGGPLSAHKGITFAASSYRAEGLSARDRAFLAEIEQDDSLRIAISYLRDGDEMRHYRAELGQNATLIAKLERETAMIEGAEIAKAADELWICRGDLGAEAGLPGMARSVARFSKQVARIDKPVLMAGQVLEHMTEQNAPTRSEVCYLWDCLEAGYHGFILSDETAIGHYPVESCRAAAMFRQLADHDTGAG